MDDKRRVLPLLTDHSSARVQHVLENAKVERSVGAWKFGAGYAGYKYGDDKWQNKPFITVTRGPVSLALPENAGWSPNPLFWLTLVDTAEMIRTFSIPAVAPPSAGRFRFVETCILIGYIGVRQ